MNEEQPFVDYYRILQVSPNCDSKILEAAYRHLAKIYHPDHSETSDVARFKEVVEAYRMLRNPKNRQKYDILHKENVVVDEAETTESEGQPIDGSAALTDAEAHEKILMSLYRKRRENGQNPGVLEYYIKEFLNCPDDIFEFHIWYLKSKGFIERTEQGTLAITVEGVDHVIAMSRTNMVEQLLIANQTATGNDAD